MILQELTATFGCLNNETLRLRPGLNVLQAPNEAGKSTWLAFLRAMLYGLPGRERGPLAEKNRYAPWNGAAMQGRMTVLDGQRTLVLTRDTAPKAPMDMVTRGCSLRLCSRSVHSISRSTSSGRSGITASFRISAPEDASSAKISDSSAASGVRSK